ncbi:SOS response-associated peptidase [Microcoleus sp. FACHB-672]|uniref:SOS response-associated peptidase n=1 Tax=Microcoleus sp. FACHB-672 TaxID=2692825 RepID=UPI00168923D9|nr:SOS response-associated peptidase [Microcoleus sp. FACHB-672]MBD2041979.1 SOS response-associated peptidase [Microcoleus sp. FACHB-672]
MCGRYSLSVQAEKIAEYFAIKDVPQVPVRYNIAPTQQVATVSLADGQTHRQFQWMRWGLIPSWAKDIKIGARLINARAETVTQKPAFRSSFKRKRCLVIADGFYEWQKVGKQKQPYYFQMKDGSPFAFAGLWDSWQPPEGETIISCTFLTTVANEVLQPVHDRMPVILQPEAYTQWLDPQNKNPEELLRLLGPYPEAAMKTYPVSTLVNSPTNDVHECIEESA